MLQWGADRYGPELGTLPVAHGQHPGGRRALQVIDGEREQFGAAQAGDGQGAQQGGHVGVGERVRTGAGDLGPGHPVHRVPGQGPELGHDVESLAFGEVDGRTVLASGSWDGKVLLWDPATGTQIDSH